MNPKKETSDPQSEDLGEEIFDPENLLDQIITFQEKTEILKATLNELEKLDLSVVPEDEKNAALNVLTLFRDRLAEEEKMISSIEQFIEEGVSPGMLTTSDELSGRMCVIDKMIEEVREKSELLLDCNARPIS